MDSFGSEIPNDFTEYHIVEGTYSTDRRDPWGAYPTVVRAKLYQEVYFYHNNNTQIAYGWSEVASTQVVILYQ